MVESKRIGDFPTAPIWEPLWPAAVGLDTEFVVC
jgi:hypothetical protein